MEGIGMAGQECGFTFQPSSTIGLPATQTQHRKCHMQVVLNARHFEGALNVGSVPLATIGTPQKGPEVLEAPRPRISPKAAAAAAPPAPGFAGS